MSTYSVWRLQKEEGLRICGHLIGQVYLVGRVHKSEGRYNPVFHPENTTCSARFNTWSEGSIAQLSSIVGR